MKHEPCSEQIVLRVAPTLRDEIEREAATEGRSLANMTWRILERSPYTNGQWIITKG